MHEHNVAHEERLNRLYYSAVRPREAVSDAKAWLLDCFEDEDDQDLIRSRNAIQTVASVEQLYEGGYRQFLRDGFNLRDS